MRTTVRLDDGLLEEARATALRSGRTLTRVIEDALRESLARVQRGRPPSDRVRLPVFEGRGLQPGVDLDSTASLMDVMDGRAPL